MISVVLRAKNEAEWIGRCLFALRNQQMGDLDIILVDNDSTDDTVKIAKTFDVRLSQISTEDFTFGRALNQGIELAKHNIVALLSSHCIPATELWADYLSAHLEKHQARHCGVYGRQEPLPETNDVDKRDLWTTFRHERIVQHQDYFFHNANSAILKNIWEQTPFDETLNGVEDCDWGRKMIENGYTIVYEPSACVYHYHGIHHGRNLARAQRVTAAVGNIRANHEQKNRLHKTYRRLDDDIIREELMALGLPLGAVEGTDKTLTSQTFEPTQKIVTAPPPAPVVLVDAANGGAVDRDGPDGSMKRQTEADLNPAAGKPVWQLPGENVDPNGGDLGGSETSNKPAQKTLFRSQMRPPEKMKTG